MYPILRIEKLHTSQQIYNIAAENNRAPGRDFYRSNIDKARSKDNIYFVKSKNINEDIEKAIATTTKGKIRKNAVRCVSLLYTLSPEAFENVDAQTFFEEAIAFHKKKFGEENIVNMVAHLDEKTPHVHILMVPKITIEDEKGKRVEFNAKKLFGSRAKLHQLQNEWNSYMKEFHPELKRCKTTDTNSQIKHLDTLSYKIQSKLKELKKIEKRYEQRYGKLKNIDNEIQEKEKRMEKMTKKQQQLIDTYEEELVRLKEVIQYCKEELRYYKSENKHKQDELQEYEAKIKSLDEEIAQRANYIVLMNNIVENTKKDLKELAKYSSASNDAYEKICNLKSTQTLSEAAKTFDIGNIKEDI